MVWTRATLLEAANVGLNMGITGIGIAKVASDIMLVDDCFAFIMKATMWGRCVNDVQVLASAAAVIITFVNCPRIAAEPPHDLSIHTSYSTGQHISMSLQRSIALSGVVFNGSWQSITSPIVKLTCIEPSGQTLLGIWGPIITPIGNLLIPRRQPRRDVSEFRGIRRNLRGIRGCGGRPRRSSVEVNSKSTCCHRTEDTHRTTFSFIP